MKEAHAQLRRFMRTAVAILFVACFPALADVGDVGSVGDGIIIKSHRIGWPIAFRAATVSSALDPSSNSAIGTPDVPPQVASAFGITDPARQLQFLSSTLDRLGHRHDTFQQTSHRVDVFTGILKIHYGPDGSLRAATGRYYPLPAGFSTDALIHPTTVEQIVSDEFGVDAQVIDSALVVVDPGWYGDPSIGPRLAYRVSVVRPSPYAEIGAFLDAANGQILDEWSLLCQAQNRAIYDGAGQSALPGALARAEGDPATAVADVDAVYDYAGDAYDFFHHAFGRDGVDDAGAISAGTARVDDIGVIPCPNAAYSFLLEQMLLCDGAAADDVVAHEWVHGLTSATANLIYQNQSGQLNESFSDVFGELVDLYNGGAEIAGAADGTPWAPHASGSGMDVPNPLRTTGCSAPLAFDDGLRWLFGEDAVSMDGPFRDLWNPGCFTQPATANDSLQTCDLLDNGGVHSGSGITNHAFAMLCDGKSFNGRTVPAIGPAKAAAVWYRALTAYLTVGSDFQDAYIAFNMAAEDLIGTTPNDPRTGLPGASPFSLADAEAVNAALLAVELDTPGACGETMPTLDSIVPIDCVTADVVFGDDFESGLGQWTVENSQPPTPYDWIVVGDLPFGREGSALFIEGRNVGNCAELIEAATHDAVSPPIATPDDFKTLTLTFDHFMEVEPRFDGGIVEIEINGGDFQQIPMPAFRHNGYNTSLYTAAEQGSSNPLAGRTVFSGVGGGWGTTVIELADIVHPADEIRLRFRFGKDNCFGFPGRGWWVDDLRVTACRSSGDCNRNAIADEIDRALGPAPESRLDQPINLRAISNYSDLDPHPTLGVNKIAEDFQLLREISLSAVRVHGGYGDNIPVSDDFTVALYESAAGVPGALIQEIHPVSSSRNSTGNVFHLYDEYAYELTLPQPVVLPAGDYFISVFNNTAGAPGTWRWARSWFGWKPGAAFLGQGCQSWCRIATANFALEILGDTIGRDPADVNGDDARNLSDLADFVAALIDGLPSQDATCAADVNLDAVLDGRDIASFVDCVAASNCPG